MSFQITDTDSRVNTEVAAQVTDLQSHPMVVALTGGGFAIAWSSQGYASNDHYRVFAQMYNENGYAVGQQIDISDIPYDEDYVMSGLAPLLNGGFVVQLTRYDNYEQASSSNNPTTYRFVGADGNPYSPTTSSYFYHGIRPYNEPILQATSDDGELIALSDGTFLQLFTWSDGRVQANHLASDGNMTNWLGNLGDPTGDYQNIQATQLINGQVVLIYEGVGVGGDQSAGGFIRFYDPGTQVLGNMQAISPDTTTDETRFLIEALPGGGFVVVFQAQGHAEDASQQGVFGQLFDANGQAIGDEFLINTTTAGDQQVSDIAVLPDGRFLVQWNSEGQDGDGWGLFGQFFDETGVRLGSELNINSITAGDQFNLQSQSLTVLNNGNIVSVWASPNLPGGAGTDIAARIIDPSTMDLTPAVDPTGDHVVNSYQHSIQIDPAIAELEGGGTVVVWTSYFQDGGEHGVYGQRYDSSGQKFGDEFLINTTTAGNQNEADVDGLPGGGFVVSWSALDGSGDGIFYQIFNENGAPVGAERQANTTTANEQSQSDTLSTNDGFLIFWVSSQHNAGLDAVVGQKFDLSGVPVGDEFVVNSSTNHDLQSVSSTILADGSVVIVWQSRDANGDWAAFGQQVAADGTNVGAEFQIFVNISGEQLDPAVKSLNDGGFYVVFQDLDPANGTQREIFGQRYDANGNEVGSETRISTNNAFSSQAEPSITDLPDGGFFVSWSNYYGPTAPDILGQRFDANGEAVGEIFTVNTETDSQQRFSELATRSDGNVQVVWYGDDDNATGIRTTLLEFEFLPVEPLVNTIYGTDNGETINGADGVDLIYGLEGRDYIFGGAGDDTLDGGGALTIGSNDELHGGNGNDTYILGQNYSGAIIFGENGSTGSNIVHFGPGITPEDINVYAGYSQHGTQRIIVEYNQLNSSGYPDRIFIENWDSAVSDFPISRFTFADGHDPITGAELNTVWVNGGGYVIPQTNAVTGTNGSDNITGTGGPDYIDGLEGRDYIFGGAGDDTLDGGGALTIGSNDELHGGEGNDTYILDQNYSGAIIFGENGSTGSNTVYFGSGITPENINVYAGYSQHGTQRIIVEYNPQNSSGYPDRIFIENWDGAASDFPISLFTFADGDDPITGAELNTVWLNGGGYVIPQTNFVTGTNGSDNITGTGGPDHIDGLEGRDYIFGGAGDDTLDGGGALTIGSNDELHGGGGNDTYILAENYSGAIIFSETDSTGINEVRFGSGINREDINVYAGYSRHGNDRIIVEYNPQNSSGYPDRIFIENWDSSASDFPISLFTFENGDTPITGEELNNVFVNGGGTVAPVNTIAGTSGADTIVGTVGADIIAAGAGDDIMSGGVGSDTFVFGVGDDTNTIQDFDPIEDRIDLSGSGLTFDDLTIQASGSNTLITGINGTTIELLGIDPSEITQDLFVL